MARSRRLARVFKFLWMALFAGMFFSRFLTHCAPSIKGYQGVIEGPEDARMQGSEGSEDGETAERGSRGLAPAAAPNAAPGTGLRLATWNFDWLQAETGKGRRPRNDGDYQALAAHGRSLAADVIAVQEVSSEAAVARVFPASDYAIYLSAAGGAQKVGFAVRRTISVRRLPDLLALGADHLRPGVDIEVGVGTGSLRLLSVHLKAGCRGAELGKSAACRKLAAQLPALEGWIDDRARHGTPFVVVGDFNRVLAADGPMWRELSDGEPSALRLAVPTVGIDNTCLGGAHPRLIDHLLLGGVACDWAADAAPQIHPYSGPALSDHCAVSLDLRPPGEN